MISVDRNAYQNTTQKETSKLDKKMNQILKSNLEKSTEIKNIIKLSKGVYHSKTKKTGSMPMVIEEQKYPI